MRHSTSKSRGFVTVTVLAFSTLLIIITSVIFETSHAVLMSYKTQRAASSAALAGLYAFKRKELQGIKEVRGIIGDIVEFPLLKKNAILDESARAAEEAAIITAHKIAGEEVQVAASFEGRTMRVTVTLPYRPLFFPIPVHEFKRDTTMSFKKS